MKKITSTTLIWLFFTFLLPLMAQKPQQITIPNGCNYMESQLEEETITVYDPDKQVQEITYEILRAFGVKPDNYAILTSLNVGNAKACRPFDKPHIIVNPKFIIKAKDKASKWTVYAVMAHELAHHLNADVFGLKNKKGKEQEIAADIFAGKMLARLGAPFDDVENIIEKMDLPEISSTHPGREEREMALIRAYEDEKEVLSKTQKLYFSIDPSAFKRPNLLTGTPALQIQNDGEKVTLPLPIPSTLNGKKLRICLKINGVPVDTRYVEGMGENIPFPPFPKIVWRYRAENFQPKEAGKQVLLQVYVFDMEKVHLPKFSLRDKLVIGGLGTFGLIGLGYGNDLIKKGKNIHEIYKNIRVENDPVYATESREDRYNRANKKFVTSQVLIYGGGAALLTGVTLWLIKRNKGPRVDPKTICTNSLNTSWEPLAVVEGNQTRVGICIRF